MTSDRTVSRLSRILSMIPYVLARDGADVADLLERFGYSKADLAKDLETVFVCGLPGYGPGDLMDAYIVDDEVVIDAADYFERAPRLTATEALALVAAGLTVIDSGQAPPALSSAVEKLTRSILSDSDVVSVQVRPDLGALAVLRDAASNGTVVRITYRSLSKESETVRDIEPWNVFTTLGNWYVQGFCRMVGAERVFRVDRIRSMEALDEHFERPAQVPIPGASYSPSDEDIVCRIALTPAARWVLEYYPTEVVSEDAAETVVEFRSVDSQVPARLLLRLGGTARLVEGAEVRKTLRAMARELTSRYR